MVYNGVVPLSREQPAFDQFTSDTTRFVGQLGAPTRFSSPPRFQLRKWRQQVAEPTISPTLHLPTRKGRYENRVSLRE